MPEPAPQQPAPPATVDETTPHHSLSEAAKPTTLKAFYRIAGGLKEGQFKLALSLAVLAEDSPHHSTRISTRDLCKHANLSESALPTALKRLAELGYITIRHGAANRPNAYLVNFLNTVLGAPFAEAPCGKGAPFREAPAPLFERQGASFAEAPPTDSKAVTRAAPSLDGFRLDNPVLDRVLKSKVSDFDPRTLAYFRQTLHSYMAKFGQDDRSRRYIDTGEKPHPPDNLIVAQFLSVAEPHRLIDLLQSLSFDAAKNDSLQPHHYSWFLYVALNRLEGIHWSQTAKAQAQLRIHRRGCRGGPTAPAPVQQPGELFNENPSVEEGTDTAAMLRTATAKVKNLR